MKIADFLAAKKGLKSSFNWLKLFCLDIFDELVGFYILLKQLVLETEWPLSQWPIRARGIIVKYAMHQS